MNVNVNGCVIHKHFNSHLKQLLQSKSLDHKENKCVNSNLIAN